VCLNDLRGLKSTFESVRGQRHLPVQWIVADGGSSDGTQNWLASLGWSRLSWSSGRDGGIYQGMNKGLRDVDADYVLFLNSGDTLATVGDLASVSDFLQRSALQPALLYGDSFEIDTSGAAYLRRARPAWWIWLGMPTTHQSMYFRTDAIRDGFDTRYRWSGDYDAVARLYMANRGADFSHLAQPLCRFHLGGRSDQNRRVFLRENLEIRRRILGMGPVPAIMLHVAHHTQGLIKRHAPFVHRVLRYG
jgi:putative colanic acid biosynthesis glycosyltransferase